MGSFWNVDKTVTDSANDFLSSFLCYIRNAEKSWKNSPFYWKYEKGFALQRERKKAHLRALTLLFVSDSDTYYFFYNEFSNIGSSFCWPLLALVSISLGY